MLVLVGSVVCLSDAVCYENISQKFAKYINEEKYKEAYALYSPKVKTFTEDKFVEDQKLSREIILKSAGKNGIMNLERVDIQPSSLLNENTLKYLFTRKLPEGEYFNIFQFVLDEDKVYMFKVSYDSSGIIGYEYDPDLAALYQQSSMPYKRVVIE